MKLVVNRKMKDAVRVTIDAVESAAAAKKLREKRQKSQEDSVCRKTQNFSDDTGKMA